MEMSDPISTTKSDDKAMMCPVKLERVEIDTSLPFDSVKAAVSLFGEKIDPRKSKLQEKRSARDVDLLRTQTELLKVKEQLANAEKVKAKALFDLAEARNHLEHITDKQKETNVPDTSVSEGSEVHVKNVEKMEQGLSQIEEKHVVWETQSTTTKEQHMITFSELESARQELADLKQELLASMTEKDDVSKQTKATLAALEDKKKRAEDLSREIAEINESLVLLKLASIEASKEKNAIVEAKDAAKKASIRNYETGLQHSNHKSEMQNELECKLAAMLSELERLEADIKNAKQAEVPAASVATEAHANLGALQVDLERTRMSGESAAASLRSLSTELEEAKVTLKKELDNGASYSAILESLRADSERMKKELIGVTERELNATAAASVVTGELTKIRAELTAAAGAEAKVIESILGLQQAFEQVEAEAAQAKADAEALQAEASRAKSEAEQAKVAMRDAESQLQSALQESDAAKAAEAAAVERVKSLSLKMHATRASEVGSSTSITISRDEYDSLKRKVQESEELANMRVAAAMAQVEAVRTSEQGILRKLVMLSEDIESIKAATKQALLKAEMAAGAKSAVEGELKRLREREQVRREKEMTMSGQLYYMENGDEQISTSFSRMPRVESLGPLGDLLSINVDSGGATKTVDRTPTHTQKKSLLNSFGSFLSKRNSFSSKPHDII